MLSSSHISGFVPTADSKKARQFYEGTLGLAFEHEDEYVIVFRTDYARVVMHKLKDLQPAHYTVMGWEVPDIQKTVSLLTDRGVVFEKHNWMQQDDLGIWKTPTGGSVAWFKDPDHNILSISQK